jgi:glycosyltransferase involved in cell wall biosynthesis
VKVALVCSLAGGGPLEHALVLAGGLAAAGTDVRALCATPALAARFAAAGAEPVVAPLEGASDVAGARRLRAALAGVDVVHAQDRRSGLWTRLPPRPGGRAACVYTVHGLPDPYLPPPAGPPRPGLRALVAYRGLDAALARWRTDALIVPSQALAALFVRRLGFPQRRITVIPNGVEPGAPLARLGEAVGTLSVLEPVKGLDIFLEAAAALARERPALRFAIFGTGSQAQALIARARTLGVAQRVALPGHVAARDALAQLRVLALPSLMENSPMALLEAMAAGVPVVASAVGGIPELAPAGTALLVPPRDAGALAAAIGRLLDDPALRTAQVAAARAQLERNGTAAVMTRRTLAVYASVAR